MLYQRYSNPLELLQQMLVTEQLHDFICNFIRFRNEELNEKTQWEYYLHKIYNMSFDDFVKSCSGDAEPEEADMNEIEATVKNSQSILESFSL